MSAWLTEKTGTMKFQNELLEVATDKACHYFYTGRIGTLTLRVENMYEDFPVYYRRDGELFLNVYTQNPDRTGEAYFLYLTK